DLPRSRNSRPPAPGGLGPPGAGRRVPTSATPSHFPLALFSTRPSKPALEQPFDERREAGSVVGVGHFLDRLRLSRIRMNRLGDALQPKATRHRQSNLRDHLPRVTRHHGSADNAIAPGADVNFHKPIGLAVEHGSIHLAKLLHKSLDGD